EALKGTGQEQFPAAEVYAVTRYLFLESRGHLKGDDTYRKNLQHRLEKLHGRLAEGLGSKDKTLSENERKGLEADTRGIAAPALLSSPERAQDINARAAALQDLHARLIEASRSEGGKAPTDLDISKELARLRQEIIDLARPTPISLGLRDYDGHLLFG